LVVLIVSPSPFLRKLIKYTIEGPNIFPLEAANSQEGLALYQTNPISLTIMDLPLAAQPALEGISQIMSLNNNAKIIVTGIYSQSASIAKALELGAMDFINKPFSQYEFRQRIYNILQGQIDREFF